MIKINLQLFGGGRLTAEDWATYSTTHISSKKNAAEIYTSRSLDASLNPKDVKVRESCDSIDNPLSSPIIVGLDVTGSMDDILEAMARKGLATLAEEVYNRKPVSDPHIMFMGIGDVACGDSAPLQVTQFEADIRIAEQLQKMYLEGGGGGNGSESYALAWYFAAMHTRIDSFEKRQKKGYLFTIGDDGPTPFLTRNQIESVFGYKPEADLSAEQLLTMASRQYEVYHLNIMDGRRSSHTEIHSRWTALLGERAIKLTDHNKMGEVIVSILQHSAGVDKDTIKASWDGSTGLVVASALDSLTSVAKTAGGIVKFQ